LQVEVQNAQDILELLQDGLKLSGGHCGICLSGEQATRIQTPRNVPRIGTARCSMTMARGWREDAHLRRKDRDEQTRRRILANFCACPRAHRGTCANAPANALDECGNSPPTRSEMCTCLGLRGVHALHLLCSLSAST